MEIQDKQLPPLRRVNKKKARTSINFDKLSLDDNANSNFLEMSRNPDGKFSITTQKSRSDDHNGDWCTTSSRKCGSNQSDFTWREQNLKIKLINQRKEKRACLTFMKTFYLSSGSSSSQRKVKRFFSLPSQKLKKIIRPYKHFIDIHDLAMRERKILSSCAIKRHTPENGLKPVQRKSSLLIHRKSKMLDEINKKYLEFYQSKEGSNQVKDKEESSNAQEIDAGKEEESLNFEKKGNKNKIFKKKRVSVAESRRPSRFKLESDLNKKVLNRAQTGMRGPLREEDVVINFKAKTGNMGSLQANPVLDEEDLKQTGEFDKGFNTKKKKDKRKSPLRRLKPYQAKNVKSGFLLDNQKLRRDSVGSEMDGLASVSMRECELSNRNKKNAHYLLKLYPSPNPSETLKKSLSSLPKDIIDDGQLTPVIKLKKIPKFEEKKSTQKKLKSASNLNKRPQMAQKLPKDTELLNKLKSEAELLASKFDQIKNRRFSIKRQSIAKANHRELLGAVKPLEVPKNEPNQSKMPKFEGRRRRDKRSKTSFINPFELPQQTKPKEESFGVFFKTNFKKAEMGTGVRSRRTKISFLTQFKKKNDENYIKPLFRRTKALKAETSLDFFNSRKKNLSGSNSQNIRNRSKAKPRRMGLRRSETIMTDRTFVLDEEIDRPNLRKLYKFFQQNYLKPSWITENKLFSAMRFDSNIPLFSCGANVRKNVFYRAGTGLNLFFNYMKCTLALMFVFFLVTLPHQFVNYGIYHRSGNPNLKPVSSGVVSSIMATLTSTTLGSLAGFSQISLKYNFQWGNQTLYASCEYGKITVNPNYTKFGLVEKERSLEQVSFIVQEQCTNYTGVMMSMQKCIGRDYCNISYDARWVSKDCSEELDKYYGLMIIHCKEIKLNFLGLKDSSLVRIYTANLILLVCFPIFSVYYFILLYRTYKKITHAHHTLYYLPNDFTIQIKDLPYMNETQAIEYTKNLLDDLYKTILNKKDYPLSPVMDIQVGQKHDVYILSSKLAAKEEERQSLLAELKKAWNTTLLPSTRMKLNSLLQTFEHIISGGIIDASDKQKLEDAKKCVKILTKLIKVTEDIKDFEFEMLYFKRQRRKIKSVFVTFELREHKKMFLQLLSKQRGWCCYRKRKDDRAEREKRKMKRKGSADSNSSSFLIKQKIDKIYAVTPSNPLNINWFHPDRPLLSILLRRFLSWTIYISLFTLPIAITVFFKPIKSDLQQILPNCSAFGEKLKTENMFKMVENWSPMEDALKCICIARPKILSADLLINKYNKEANFCSSTQSESSQYVLISALESLILNAMTIFFDFAFDWMAKFEAYSEYSKRQANILLKLFLWKYIVSSILPIFATTDFFDIIFFQKITRTAYDDFQPGWFLKVGTTIILSLYIRILVIVVDFLFNYYLPRVIQWYDIGGYNRPLTDLDVAGKDSGVDLSLVTIRTRKKDQKSVERVYRNLHFRIERSYAEVLHVVYYCFTFVIFLPGVFIPSCLILIVMFFKDKILTLTVYRSKYHLGGTLDGYTRFLSKFAPLTMFYFAFRLCGSQLYNLDINLIKDVIIELDPTSKQLESNVDLPIKFHSFNSRIDYLVHNITRHSYFWRAFINKNHRMSITKANQKIRKLRMFSSMLSITNSSLKLPSPFKAQDQQKADEEAEKTKKEGKSQNEGQPNNDEVGHDNEKVLDCFYEMVNKQEHNYNKLIPFVQINDEIELYNRNLKSTQGHSTQQELSKRRISYVKEFFDKFSSGEKRELYKNFLNEYQFTTLASYNFCLNPRFKTYFMTEQFNLSRSKKKRHSEMLGRQIRAIDDNPLKMLRTAVRTIEFAGELESGRKRRSGILDLEGLPKSITAPPKRLSMNEVEDEEEKEMEMSSFGYSSDSQIIDKKPTRT